MGIRLNISIILLIFLVSLMFVYADTDSFDNLNNNRYTIYNVSNLSADRVMTNALQYPNGTNYSFGSSSGGNTSWNESRANTLYAPLIWGYNMSTPFTNWLSTFIFNYNQSIYPISYLNNTYGLFWYNMSDGSGNSSWNESRGNEVYLGINNLPTHLSNFTDNLGNRGYTSVSNFTNNLNYINATGNICSANGTNSTGVYCIPNLIFRQNLSGNTDEAAIFLKNGSIYSTEKYKVAIAGSVVTVTYGNNTMGKITQSATLAGSVNSLALVYQNASGTNVFTMSYVSSSGALVNIAGLPIRYVTNVSFRDYINVSQGNVCLSNGTGCNGNVSWSSLKDFPVACPSGTYVTQINNSITCSSVPMNQTIFNTTYNNLLGQSCPSGQVVNGTLSNGTIKCQNVPDSMSYTNLVLKNQSNVLIEDNWFMNGLYINNSLGNLVFDSTAYTIYDESGLPSIDWDIKNLLDTSTVQAVDWENRILYDSTGGEVVDWENRILYGDFSGTNNLCLTNGTGCPISSQNLTNVAFKNESNNFTALTNTFVNTKAKQIILLNETGSNALVNITKRHRNSTAIFLRTDELNDTFHGGIEVREDPNYPAGLATYILSSNANGGGRIIPGCLDKNNGNLVSCYSINYANIRNWEQVPASIAQQTTTSFLSGTGSGVGPQASGNLVLYTGAAEFIADARTNSNFGFHFKSWGNATFQYDYLRKAIYSYDTVYGKSVQNLTANNYTSWSIAGVTKQIMDWDGNLDNYANITARQGFKINETDIGLTVNQYINATCTLYFRGGILTQRSAGC